jgi:hypothetical protein
MHDPMTVAHEIRRPWPQRTSFPGSQGARWSIRLHHTHFEDELHPGMCEGCNESMTSTNNWFPWWKPSSYMSHWRLAGREYYWPPLLTIWHNEPDSHDGLSVCSRRYQDKQGKWHYTKSWKWHVHHWSFQFPPLQQLRRRLFTRCIYCGGKSVKGHPVNVTNSWDHQKSHWWRSEVGLFHADCDQSVKPAP